MPSSGVIGQLRAAALLLLGVATLSAQLNRGIVEGVVTDPPGAIVAGVEVAITSLDTNITASVRTNNTGYYQAGDLVPGKYRAHFVFTGFSPLDISNIEVQAGKVTRVDAQLTLGATRQTVEVLASAPLIEQGASNFSQTLETQAIDQVPVAGRDLQQLVFLFPGVNSVAGPPGTNFGFNSQYGSFPDPTFILGSNLSVSGGQAGDNAWYLDGNLNLSGFAENIVVNPSPDAVQEFQAITNGFAAEYGRTGGAVFSVVLKSGGNKLHGSGYEFLRNDFTNARNPFTSIDSLGNLIKDRQLRYNNFGGTVGGPVVLPHVYDGKNKTFFFFSVDQTILHLLGAKVYSVPTSLMRQGDFSEDPSARSSGLWNPYSTVGPDASTGLFNRQAFGTPVAGNPFGNDGCSASAVNAGLAQAISTCNFSTQIPKSLLDPTAMFFINSYPLPNYNDPLSDCPIGKSGFRICNNYLGSVGSSQDPTNISIKLDHAVNEKDRFFGEWLFNPGLYRNYRVPWTGATFPQDQVGWGSTYPVDFQNQIVALGNTYVIQSTLINETRVSFSRQYMTTHPLQPYPDSITDQKNVQSVLAPSRIPHDPLFPVPNWQITGPGSSTMQFGPTAWVNMNMMAEAYTILDNITKVKGHHTFKTGLMYRVEHGAYESGFPTILSFGGTGVQNPSTGLGGSGLAEFMMGAVSTNQTPNANATGGSGTGKYVSPYQRWRYWGAYFQDDFRVTSNLTLNLGLRWDLYGVFRTRYNEGNFCFSCMNSLTGLKGAYVYQPSAEFPSGDMFPANKHDFAPRFNFAWTPFRDKKTVIRGGYDIFYSNAYAEINAPGQGAINLPGWSQTGVWNQSSNPGQCASFTTECVAFRLSDTSTDKSQITFPPLLDLFPAQTRNPRLGQGQMAMVRPSHDPMVQMWSLQIQRELPSNMMVEIGYVGNHGTHLVGEPFASYNYIHTADKIKYKTAINAPVPITDYFSGATAQQLANVYGSSDLPRSLLVLDYPFFPGLLKNVGLDGASIYHGMNLRVVKRYSYGLNFTAAYTVSKKITNWATGNSASLIVDPFHWTRAGGLGGRAGSLAFQGIYGGSFQDPDNKAADRAISADDLPQMLNIAASYDLPVGKTKHFLNRGGLANAVLGGWRLTGNLVAQSGLPFPVSSSVCNELTCRPNLIGDAHFSGSRSREQQINQWINPAAFQPVLGSDQNFWVNYNPDDPRAYVFGTAGPRLANFRAPGFWNVDTSLVKPFHITEQKYFELRWEIFNVLNHQNLGFPNTTYCLPPNPDGSTDLVHQAGCQFGRITNIQTDPRAMEFALKFYF